MDGGELNDGREYEHEADTDEQVEGRRVGDLGQVLPVVDAEESHRQHCRDACNINNNDIDAFAAAADGDDDGDDNNNHNKNNNNNNYSNENNNNKITIMKIIIIK